jgi:hypothetical protein
MRTTTKERYGTEYVSQNSEVKQKDKRVLFKKSWCRICPPIERSTRKGYTNKFEKLWN